MEILDFFSKLSYNINDERNKFYKKAEESNKINKK